ncbi:hypothetical protein GCM10010515_66660 [Streptomyces fructofermentans]|uniref:Uncharacterized protein n=1 Tax=Streptomyces fructofermentans TaxID=152141 RepID=A0A918U4H9_9ACTN|nr:hypothetical protein GCM10010515_66660 [Streptomyces fructofermentans]
MLKRGMCCVLSLFVRCARRGGAGAAVRVRGAGAGPRCARPRVGRGPRRRPEGGPLRDGAGAGRTRRRTAPPPRAVSARGAGPAPA